MERGEQLHSYLDHQDAVVDLAFHPDGGSFYSVSLDGTLSRWEIHPEIFVLKYAEKDYREAMDADPVFAPRQSGESRREYQERLEEARVKRDSIVESLYKLYLDR